MKCDLNLFLLPYVNNETLLHSHILHFNNPVVWPLQSAAPKQKQDQTAAIYQFALGMAPHQTSVRFLERASRTEYTDCVQRGDWRWSWTIGTAQCSGTGSGSAQCNSGSGLGTAALQGYCTHTADSGDGHRTGDKTQAVVHTDMEGGSPMNEKETDKSGWLDFISNSQKKNPQQEVFCSFRKYFVYLFQYRLTQLPYLNLFCRFYCWIQKSMCSSCAWITYKVYKYSLARGC